MKAKEFRVHWHGDLPSFTLGCPDCNTGIEVDLYGEGSEQEVLNFQNLHALPHDNPPLSEYPQYWFMTPVENQLVN